MILALAFIAAGYPLAYWGANNIKHWDRSVLTTDAAPLSLLYAVASPQQLRDADKLPGHDVPFPYRVKTTSGGTQPSSNSGSGGTSQSPGGSLSPNYPGGPNGTIPTPPVGGQPV